MVLWRKVSPPPCANGFSFPPRQKLYNEFSFTVSTIAITGSLTEHCSRYDIADNGIGMSHDELVENLGTIAKSGTADFLKAASENKSGAVNLIGQFGVGFYSCFMVADKVEVRSRKAGESVGWLWTSEGKGRFSLEESPKVGRGVSITLHLNKDSKEYLEPLRLRTIVKTYSDHIALPVKLEGGDKGEEVLNSASALWTRPKSEVSEDQYKEFYHHVAHAFDEPWMTLHTKAEGAIEYTGLLFTPSQRPFDLFSTDRRHRVKLYVNRVFITDNCEGLLPPYLRFLRGVVDSPDLPLNVSREMLQHQPLLAKIKTGLTKKYLAELKKKSEDAADYATFWTAFGAVFKEGVYEDFERKLDILKLCRFHSTKGPDLVSLEDYVGRMKEGQEAIYYITGDDRAALEASPQLEGFKARDVEVLLLTDPIDEFWTGAVTEYEGKKMTSAAHAGSDLSKIAKTAQDEAEKKPEEAPADDLEALTKAMTEALGDAVSEVRPSDRLTESPVCLAPTEGGMSLHLERMLRQHGQDAPTLPRVLEINPAHSLIKALASQAKAGGDVADAARLLMDQARVLEGESLPDPNGFAKRLTAILEKGLG